MQLLTERGADATAADQDGDMAMMVAAQGGHLSCLQFLVENEADITMADQNGMTTAMFV